MTQKSTFHQRRRETRVVIKQALPHLRHLKREQNREAFKELLLKALPEIEAYVNRRIRTVIPQNHLVKNKYNAYDFIDQLFIETYDHIEAFENEDEFVIWLYKTTNKLLDDTFTQEEFHELFYEDIGKYLDQDRKKMEEKFFMDGDGDLVMNEDLDDISYYQEPYKLDDIFTVDTAEKLDAAIDEDLHQDEVNKHVQVVLLSLPISLQIVFDLFTKHHLTVEEIAIIGKSNTDTVNKLLADARKAIQNSLLKRFPSVKVD